ncbi:sensor histidine kinase [Paenibacillus piri]|nr:sensor histidine kinase [Paenibacillus piri]
MRSVNIRPLLLFLFLSINFVYLIAIILLVYVHMFRVIVDEASQTRRLLLNELNKQVTLTMRGVEETAINISTHPVLLNALTYKTDSTLEYFRAKKEISDMINHFVFTSPNFSSIRIYTDNLITDGTPSGAIPLAPLSEYEWDNLAQTGKSSIWIKSHKDLAVFDKDTEVLSFVKVLKNAHNEFAGYLKINLKVSYLISSVLDRNGTGSKLILDSSGQIISVINDPLHVQNQYDYKESKVSIEKSYAHVMINNVSYLEVFSEPNYYGWSIIETIPYEELFRNLNSIKKVLLFVGALGVLLSFVVSYYLSRKMTSFVSGMLHSFEQVECGRFNIPQSKYVIYEVQQVYNGFHKMMNRLHMLLAHLEIEQKQKLNAELNARLAQINPHFLYNTLDAIHWMAIQKGADEAGAMTAKLSRLFRIGLSQGKLFILLGEELEHGFLYYELQREKYKNDIRLIMDVPAFHKLLFIPKLILQPFIENAIIHGFVKSLHHSGNPLVIRIHTSLDENNLFIFIDNNGNALGASGYYNIETKTQSGYGIKNIRERINLNFGHDFGVDIQELHPSEGVRVTIKLPQIHDMDQLDNIRSRDRRLS